MGAKRVFSETRMFNYHRRMKIASGILWVFGIAIFLSLFISFLALRNSDIPGIVFFRNIMANITSNIADSTLLGIAYTSLIGGLFFIFMPMEVLFGRFLGAGHQFITVLFLYLAGLSAAYTANYFIGLKFARISKKLISPRKFYALKGKINKYGGIAIYFFNALPLPSQILAAILGVFKYNKTRFYVFFLLGQLTKCVAISLGVYYFL